MTPQIWIGFGFAAVLAIFMMVAFFAAPRLTPGQWNILRIFNALLAGCAGGFLIGEATLSVTGEIAKGLQASIYGTAGIAVFLIIWFSYTKYIPSPILPDATHTAVPHGWTFRQAVDAIVSQDGSVADYVGFRDNELRATLRGQQLHAHTTVDLLKSLRALASPGAIREYDVSFEKPIYQVRVRQKSS